MNPEVDPFFDRTQKWQDELRVLRRIVLECGLTEELKWKVPCYTDKNKNIVLIHGFKDFFALLFMKGSLLQDPENILVQQTENVQSGRQIRLTSSEQVLEMEATLKAYIFEAIEVEKAGLKIDYKSVDEFEIAEEFQAFLDADASLKTAFEALTPGRQKGYHLHFNGPKQSKTRISRIENSIPRIRNGKGLNDCICGHSKRMPNCDGSHKFFT